MTAIVLRLMTRPIYSREADSCNIVLVEAIRTVPKIPNMKSRIRLRA